MRDLCLQYTDLTDADIDLLEKMEAQLPFIAELTETDIFIDAPANNGVDAIVLAWARPEKHSLYGHSVVGEIAYATREPAVYQTFSTGEMVRNVRGVSQEGVPIAQTVVPLRNDAGRVVGVLIMEKDISEEIRQEARFGFLSEAADQLSNTLMALSMTGSSWEEWLGNGLFVLNHQGAVTYANRNAARMYRQYCGGEPLGGKLMDRLSCRTMEELVDKLANPMEFEFGSASFIFQSHALVAYGGLSGCVLSMQDVSELRRKERELNAQSATIREIHHRVKNNLQTVAALLRLQSRRMSSPEGRDALRDAQRRVQSIAAVHEILSQGFDEAVPFDQIADRILLMVGDVASAAGQVCARREGSFGSVPGDIATSLSLVMTELCQNAIEHGLQSSNGTVIVHAVHQGRRLVLEVIDDGAGLPGDFELSTAASLGLSIVSTLVNDLGGEFTLRNNTGHGSTARVELELPANLPRL